MGIFSPKTKPKVVLGVMLLLLSGGFVLMLLSNIGFGFTVASVLVALLFSAILWVPVLLFGLAFVTGGAINPKTHFKKCFGVWLILCSGVWVLVMLKNVADSSLDGNARAAALIVLIFSAILWAPAVIFGLSLMGGGRYLVTTRKPRQIDCLVCCQSMPSLALFCPHCGSEAHRSPNCQSCGAPRQAHHRFCRVCGAKAA